MNIVNPKPMRFCSPLPMNESTGSRKSYLPHSMKNVFFHRILTETFLMKRTMQTAVLLLLFIMKVAAAIAQAPKLQPFSESVIEDSTKKTKFGFKDSTGNIVIAAKYDWALAFSDTYAGNAKVTNNKKWGLIDTKGNEVIPVIYDDLEYFKDNGLIAAK